MRKIIIFLCLLACLWGSGMIYAADFATPNTGATFTLSDITTLSAGTTVHGGPTSYTLAGTLTVSPLDILQINAGQSLRAIAVSGGSLPHGVIIKGRLVCDGTEVNPILLGSHEETPGAWRGVILASSGGSASSIRRTRVEYAGVGVNMMGSIAPIIEYNTFYKCLISAITIGPNCSGMIQYNQITPWSHSAGIILNHSATASVKFNTITGGAIGIGASGTDSATQVTDNNIQSGYAGLVSSAEAAGVLQKNKMENGILGGVAADISSAVWDENEIKNQTLAGMGIVNNAAPQLRKNIFIGNATLGGLFIDDEASPDLGNYLENGENNFSAITQWNAVNFSTKNYYALGNTWSSANPAEVIYDQSEDTGDADGNGVISGILFHEIPSSVQNWSLY